MGDIGLVEIPKQDRPKNGQRNLLVQVVAIESDQLVLAPILKNGVGPNLSTRCSTTDFVKGIDFNLYSYMIFLCFFLSALQFCIMLGFYKYNETISCSNGISLFTVWQIIKNENLFLWDFSSLFLSSFSRSFVRSIVCSFLPPFAI